MRVNRTPVETSSHEVVAEVVESSEVGGAVADSFPEMKLRLLQSHDWQTAQVVMRRDVVWR